MKFNVKVSFIIPVYNCKDSLIGCINSIKRISDYSKDSFEIILIDDGSTDGTSEECDRLGDIVVHQKNSGVSVARNVGVKKASGDYVVFIDADDHINPEKFAKLLAKLDDSSIIDVVVYGMLFDYFNGKKCYRSDAILPPLQGEYTKAECLNNLYVLYEANILSPVWNKIIKRDLLQKNSLAFRTDMFLYEDLEFSIRLLSVSETWYFDNKLVYHYFQTEINTKLGGRLKRMKNLSQLVDTIHFDLQQTGENHEQQTTKLILALYLVLVREKISISDRGEIITICDEFAYWIDTHILRERIKNNKYAMLVYCKKVNMLIAKRVWSDMRHNIAVMVKSIVGDFRKWHI